MRVLLISFSTNSDLQSYMYNLNLYFDKLGIDCTTIGSNDMKVNIAIQKNNILIDTPERPTINFKSLILFLKNFKRIISEIKEKKPDIIHFTSKHIWNYPLIKYLKVLKKLGKKSYKVVHTIHDPVGHKGEKIQKQVYYYYKIINSNVDGVILHSKNSENDYLNNYKFINKYCVTQLGEYKLKEYKNLNFNKKVLVFGRLNAYKGLEYLPLIADELIKLDSEITINVYGKCSDDISNELINEIIKRKNIDFNNRFIMEEEVELLFDNTDITLITYTSISQSGVIPLSFVNSRPIVAFGIHGITEFINNKNSIIIEPFEVKKMAKNIYEILNNKNKLKKLSLGAWSSANEKYNIQNMGNEIYAFYKIIS